MAISDIQAKFNKTNHIYKINSDIDLSGGALSLTPDSNVTINSVVYYYKSGSTVTLTTGQSIDLESGVALLSSDVTSVVLSTGVYTTSGTTVIPASTTNAEFIYRVGETLTIPAGCTLDFQGGSFSNGTIVFNNTSILGDAKLDINPSGTISGIVDVSWFGLVSDDNTFDNGVIINKVANVFKNLYIPVGRYYVVTPIVISGVGNITVDGNLYYYGTTIGITLVTIKKSSSSIIKLNGVISGSYKSSIIDFTDYGSTNMIGVDIHNVTNSNIEINTISYFNECLRISASRGGCSCNSISINSLIQGNYLLRIYQDNAEGSIGWCNENTFYSGRLFNYTEFYTSGLNKSTAINISGPGDSTDTYDSCDSLKFIKFDVENFRTPVIICRSTTFSEFDNFRWENCTTPLIKVLGTFRELQVNGGYGLPNLFQDIYDSENASDSSFSFLQNYENTKEVFKFNISELLPVSTSGTTTTYASTSLGFTSYSNPIRYGYTNYLGSGVQSNGKIIFNTSCPSAIIDTTTYKLFRTIYDGFGRFAIVYLEDSDGNTIDYTQQGNYIGPKAGFYLNDRCWFSSINASGTIFIIPNNVTKILLMVVQMSKGMTTWTAESLFGAGVVNYTTNPILTSGTTAQRPTVTPAGFIYYDTDLGYSITWDGTQWINYDGTLVSKLSII